MSSAARTRRPATTQRNATWNETRSALETRPGRSVARTRRLPFYAAAAGIVLIDGAPTARALEPNLALGYAGPSPIARQVMRGPETDP